MMIRNVAVFATEEGAAEAAAVEVAPTAQAEQTTTPANVSPQTGDNITLFAAIGAAVLLAAAVAGVVFIRRNKNIN